MIRTRSKWLRHEQSLLAHLNFKPQVELLEDRTVPDAGLYYWANGVRIPLEQQTNQFAVKVTNDDTAMLLKSLATSTGPLAGFEVKDSLGTNVWRIQSTGSHSTGPNLALAIDDLNLSGVEWITPGFVNPDNGATMLIINEMIVGLKPGINAGTFFANLDKSYGVASYRPLLGTPDQFVVTLANATGSATVLAANQLSLDPRVDYASPHLYQDMKRFFIPNDTLYPQQWHLNNTGSQLPNAVAGADVKIQDAWNIGSGNGVVIAVLDDGMERTHPDLAANIFVNPGEIPGDGIDNDGNGWIDDVSGWSYVTNSGNFSVTVNDEHATSVAGIAAAVGNNNLGVTGAAFNAKILPLQMFNGGSYVGDAGTASAIYYAAGRTADGLGTWNAAQVMNCSWGGGSPSAALTNAFTWANNVARGGLGVATFISSGNGYSSSVSYPANLSLTLNGLSAVGATNQADLRSEYSNYGAALDFVTPSSDIDAPITGGTTTTDRTGNLGYNVGDYTNNTAANGFGGTSSASPLAAGIGAVMLSIDPSLSAAQVKTTLRATADKVGGVIYDGNGFHVQYGYGRLNAFAAVQTLGMNVIGTTPANGAIVNAPPALVGGYRVDFNFDYDPSPANVDLSKVSVNGINPVSFTVVDSNTIQFNFAVNPVTAEGVQTFVVDAGAVERLSNGEPVGQYSGSFRYDINTLAVVSTTPPFPNGVFTLPGPFSYTVNFNEPINPASVQTSDLVISGIAGATVTGAAVQPGNTAVVFTISGITTEGTFTASIGANAITDAFDNPGTNFSEVYEVDFGVVNYPTPLAAKNPLGSLIYDPAVNGRVNFAGDTDSFLLTIDANQTLSVIVRPTSPGLQPRIDLFDPINASMGFASAGAPGQITGLQTVVINAAGTYRIQVSSVGGTTGDYTVEVILNAAFELEGNVVGATNNSVATAQNINGSVINLTSTVASASRGAVLGTTDFAGYSASAVTFGFENISGTGTVITGLTGVDDASVSIPIGFSFPFYGTNNTSVFVGSNGSLVFGSANTSFSNTDLTTLPTQAAIMPFWDDLHTAGGVAGSNVFFQVTGVGNDQHLTVQWNNIRFFSGGTAGDTLTFQAQLYVDGRIRFNYLDLTSGSAGGNNGASATVGIKAAGTQGPDRLLLAFNNGPNTFVGTGQSTLISPPNPTADYYAVNFTAGQFANIAATALTAGNLTVELRNAADAVLATGVGGFTNVSSMISNYQITTTGTYYVRVGGASSVPYSVVVGNNTAFDVEANDTFATAQPIAGNKGALGAIFASGSTVYTPNVLTFGFEDISATGTVIAGLTNADDAAVSIPIGFNFNFYNTNQTSVFVSSNGLMTFGTANTGFTNADLTTTPTQAAIAPFWDDLHTGGGAANSNVYFQVLGAGPTQRLVVQWNQVRFFSGGTTGDTLTFQAVLYAADGTVRFNYLDLVSGSAAGNNGGSATVGIKDAGTQGPNRVLLGFNVPGGNTFVGTGKSTSLTLPPAEDWYSFYVDANKQLRVDTSTPGDGLGEPQVLLDPDVEIYDPNGNLAARGLTLADGRNEIARINRTTLAGMYRARIRAEGGSTGVYFMGVYTADTGRSISLPAASSDPSNRGDQLVPSLLTFSSSKSTAAFTASTSTISNKTSQTKVMTDALLATASRKTGTLDQKALAHFFVQKNKPSASDAALAVKLADQAMLKMNRTLV